MPPAHPSGRHTYGGGLGQLDGLGERLREAFGAGDSSLRSLVPRSTRSSTAPPCFPHRSTPQQTDY
ncbi:hypothetical protein [Nostocoides veronense]|uniref:hypothetical protein n=1 Tax=Nostocoides veronense TaxID=330836 RepID=UPI0031DEDB47